MKENSCNYSDQWQSYVGDYDKFEYDIKLTDGTIVENCYPNADSFTPFDTNKSYSARKVAEIRFSNKPKSYLNLHVSEKCKEHYAELDRIAKEKIVNEGLKIITNKQTPCLQPMIHPETFGKENAELIDSMIAFAKTTTGIGLAANQCSNNGERLMDRFFLHLDNNEWKVIIDPKIVEYIGIVDKRTEGCLSWPAQTLFTKRYRRIKVSYYTIDGEYKEEMITKFDAHVWQHEIDHLNGVVEDFLTPALYKHLTINDKIQRNETCTCGSGLKYKKCCGPYEIAINNYQC